MFKSRPSGKVKRMQKLQLVDHLLSSGTLCEANQGQQHECSKLHQMEAPDIFERDQDGSRHSD